MFCPACGAEYRERFRFCADCDTALVERPPTGASPSSGKLVTVLEAHDQAVVMLAKGLLESADIPYFARNDQFQDLLGWGRVGLGFKPVVSPVRIQVPEDYAEAARGILERVDGSVDGDTT